MSTEEPYESGDAYVSRVLAEAKGNNDGAFRHYWQHGEGAARIAWGTSGDYNRCVAKISKFVSKDRAQRICAQWNHDVTGYWPGDHRNPGLIALRNERRAAREARR